MEAMGSASKIGSQVLPPFVVFQTPPPTAPKKYSLGLPGTPVTGITRPPRNGPIMRHRISGKEGAGDCWAKDGSTAIMVSDRTQAILQTAWMKNTSVSGISSVFIIFIPAAEYTP